MSKMGNYSIREAERDAIDNAAGVVLLQAEVARLRSILARARAALAPVGLVPLIDVGSYLQLQGRGAMARALDEASDAICIARAALDGDGG